jgi:peptide deformylase
MMTLAIKEFGSSVLREKASDVTELSDELLALISAMLETMYTANGIGLAAEQVGHTESVCIVDISPCMPEGEAPPIPMPLVLINPEITEGSGEVSTQEGCLSFPDIYAKIRRADNITVRFRDRDFQEQTLHADGLLSRAIQHELDHLNGVLLVDRMSAIQRISVSGRLKRLKKKTLAA